MMKVSALYHLLIIIDYYYRLDVAIPFIYFNFHVWKFINFYFYLQINFQKIIDFIFGSIFQVHNYTNQREAIASVLGVFGFFGVPVYPIGNELAVETTYPVGEATSSGVIFMIGLDYYLLSKKHHCYSKKKFTNFFY